jgi:hypothetical protein
MDYESIKEEVAHFKSSPEDHLTGSQKRIIIAQVKMMNHLKVVDLVAVLKSIPINPKPLYWIILEGILPKQQKKTGLTLL